MNISAIRAITPLKSYQNTSFKGNNNSNSSNSPIQPNQPKPSAQNNSPDIFVPTETYLNIYAKGLVEDMEKDGIFNYSDEEVAEISSKAFAASDFTEALDSIFSSDIAAQQSAKTSIFGLKQHGIDLLRSVSEEKRAKVPTFIETTPENFIETLTSNLKKLQSSTPQDLASADIEEILEQANEGEKTILETGMAMFQNEEFMDSLKTMQETMAKLLKTTYKKELKEALEIYSTGLNCLLYGAIENSANRNPRDVINILTNNIMVYTQPKVKDNEDGTSTLIYNPFGTIYEVVRNNSNGDYISATGKDYSGPLFDVKFRKDGSIEELDYTSNVSNTRVIINSDPKTLNSKLLKHCPMELVRELLQEKMMAA